MANLVTINEFKIYKDINSNTEDNKISLIIAGVSDFVIQYCNRTFIDFYSTDNVEYFDSNVKTIFLTEVPLVSVTSVKTSVDGGVTQAILTVDTDYFVDIQNSFIIARHSVFLTPAVKHKSLEIIYKGGYKKIPNDLRLAILGLVQYYYKEEYIPTRSMGSATMIHISSEDALKIPAHISRILENYRI